MDQDFCGVPTQSLANPFMQVYYLKEMGPRIVRVILAGTYENQLAELPDFTLPTPYGIYSFRGGHRLWHAPEAFPRSYIPDDSGLTVENVKEGVRLVAPTEQATGIRKSIEIHLAPDRAALTLVHHLENKGTAPVELAPWAITQLPLGGMVILPQTSEPWDADKLLPNRNAVLWPYSRWDDQRLKLYEDIWLIEAQPQPNPCKIGYLNLTGWVGYLRKGVLFVKRFAVQKEQRYPDMNSNVEVYACEKFVELETLAPLVPIEPGGTVAHTETWEYHTGLGENQSSERVREIVRTLFV